MSIADQAPENTATRAPEAHVLGMLAGSDEYITGMESAGQRQLVASSVLPKKGPWDQLVELGFTKGGEVDDLFVNATLPEGWAKEGSDHAMWSYIVDARGLRMVGVFYKAAFYDRSAFMGLENPGYAASTAALYGDSFEPPAKWELFTEAERASFQHGLDGMEAQIRDCPNVYGKYADRLAAARSWLAVTA